MVKLDHPTQSLDNMIFQSSFSSLFVETNTMHRGFVEAGEKGHFLRYAMQKVPDFLDDRLLTGYRRLNGPEDIEFPESVSIDSLDYLTVWIGENKGERGKDSIVIFNARQMNLYRFDVQDTSMTQEEFGHLVYGVMRAYPKHYDSWGKVFKLFGPYAFSDQDADKAVKDAKRWNRGFGGLMGLCVGLIPPSLYALTIPRLIEMGQGPNGWLSTCLCAVPIVTTILGALAGNYFTNEETAKEQAEHKAMLNHNDIWQKDSYFKYSFDVGPSIKSNMQAVDYLQKKAIQ
ncbi:MAG: hypothetical protein KKF44_03190 [Nanoarchaeota archaeon]|nr:hypothetical protein [Nanoarchaeota archaeon]